jgi:ClpP class serine protease
MSPANKEQTQAFVQSIWNQMTDDIAQSRQLTQEQLNILADQYMDFQLADSCIANGLADTLMYKDEVLAYLKSQIGLKEKDKLHTLTLSDMINVKRNTPRDKSGNIIAVYYAYGEIDNSSSYNYNEEGINSEKVITDLRKLREDKNIKAVVLRVNSPGGSAYGSEQIWREVKLLKEEKPVIVSMGDYAASGGYYISCAADWIVAEPTTLTGSMALGMVQIVTGMAISLIEKCKRKKFLDAFFEEITWWIVFIGIALLALGKGAAVLYVGCALVLLGPIVQGKGWGKLTGVFGSLYNHVTGYFGDILSYTRLMALMLAGSVIAQVFNMLAAMPGNVIAFIIISMLGNAMNFGLFLALAE